MAKKTIGDAVSPEVAEALRNNAGKEPENTEAPKRPRFINDKLNNSGRPAKPVDEAFLKYPAHIVKIANMCRSNSDIRRYTSLGILNWMYQKGFIDSPKDGKVNFLWDKFCINIKGLSKEYRYTEEFFLNSFIASFRSLANAAEKNIKIFCKMEFDKEFNQDNEEIDKAVEASAKADATSKDAQRINESEE